MVTGKRGKEKGKGVKVLKRAYLQQPSMSISNEL
jgi:hypothetical protein